MDLKSKAVSNAAAVVAAAQQQQHEQTPTVKSVCQNKGTKKIHRNHIRIQFL